MSKITSNLIYFLTIFFFSLTISSCSKHEPIKPSIRAVERWQALIDQDWKLAYSYESPSYRKNYSIKDFRLNYGKAVEWKSIEYKSTTPINDKTVDVSLTLIFTFMSSSSTMDLPSPLKERWQLIDDTWWHIN